MSYAGAARPKLSRQAGLAGPATTEPAGTIRQTALLFAAAVLATLIRCLYLSPHFPAARGEMDAVALTLARFGFFGNPFPLTAATGPTAFVPPLYPLFLSLLVRLFGDPHYLLPLAVITSLVYGLHAALLPRLSEALLGRRQPGIWASLTCIVAPVLLWFPNWDVLYTAVGLMLFTIFALRLRTAGTRTRAAACGLLAGLLALLNPSSLLVTLPFVVLVAWGIAPRALVVVVFLSGVLLATAPWLARNYLVMHTLSLKDNFGATAFASNNDCTEPSLKASLDNGCHAAHHPFGSLPEALQVRAMGEAAYDRSRLALALQWAGRHRPAFLRLTLLRVVQFWFPSTAYRTYAVSCWLITLGSVSGLALLRRRHALFFRFCLIVFAVYPLIYYAVVSDPRYRYPILWLSLLGYGYLVEEARLRLVPWLRLAPLFSPHKRLSCK